MESIVGRTVILVRDYEEALMFYRENFGFTILFDQETPDGLRLLHIGCASHKGSGIWFIKASDHEQQAAVGRQAPGQPLLVIYTPSLGRVYERLLQNKVKVRMERHGDTTHPNLHCYDLYGNEIVVAEMKF
jgi:catechol 2,3-dioxygenase-like lactoylglutathione lyase family enzyme